MSLLEQTLPGSYKGVNFLMASGSVTGGPKIVKHEYPNSDTQTIETLGLIPRAYSVVIVIGGGDNYYTRRDELLRILEDESLGKLTHPLYGDIENVIALPYTLTENFNNLGAGQISVVFEVSEGTGVPERTLNTINTVETSNDAVIAAVNVGFVATYEIKLNQPATYTDALSKGQDAVTAFSTNTKAAQGAADKINNFNNNVNSFKDNITSLVSDAQGYIDTMQSLFDEINSLYTTVEDTITIIESFSTFGDTDVTLNPTTPSRITRDTNRDALNAAIQTVALSYSYFNSAQLTFATVSDIEKRANTLEAQYQKVIIAEGLDEDTREALTQLRLNTQQFFEAEKLTAQQIITVNTYLTSARLLAHSYYGNSDLGAQIADINNSKEPTFIEGDVSILTA